MSRPAFDARFSDEEACSHSPAEHRWPEGFVCPSCGTCKGWPLKRNGATWECAGCGRQRQEGTRHAPLAPPRVLQPENVGKGGFHGLRKCHLQRYLDEFVFRWNRRRHMRSGFDTLLGIGVGLGPETYRDFVEQRA
jgi:ribosomal protein L37AE/L43A